MAKDENIKTIRFPVKTDERLQAVANKCGLTKLGCFIHMTDYFYKNKKDPRDLSDELLKNALNKKTDNIVAFIRTQEQELLIPIKKDVEHLLAGLAKILQYFQSEIITHNEDLRDTCQNQSVSTGRILEYLKRADQAQLERKKLKEKVSAILEYYISAREQMGMMTKQTDKDALIQNVRQQVNNL
ncbi:hypothetical protein FFF34_002610 [Inquilinus sp. KBS0705]|nr:hypothetical protein FFF34_002610 [Inquilinus sp. KBS0705]